MSAWESFTVRAPVSLSVDDYSDERTVRTFDKESIIDPNLKPILKHTKKTAPSATVEPSASGLPGSSTVAESAEDGEKQADPMRKIQLLEKQLAELKLEKDEVEHKLQSERDRTEGAEKEKGRLQEDLRRSQDVIDQLEKRFAQQS